MNTLDELHARYLAALHAVQSGVEYRRRYDRSFVSEKHMRTGIDSAHVSQAALIRVLIAKGVLTQEEYMEALVRETEDEKARYEAELTAHFGRPVTLA